MSLNTILATTPLTSTGYHLKATGTTIGNSLIWDNGTNVGIGTASPDTLLHLSSTTDTSILRLERNSVTITSGQSYGQVQWEGQDASTGAAGVRSSIDVLSNGTLGETNLVFRTSGSNFNANLDRLTIDSSGNLGLGVTPSAWSGITALQIGGYASFGGDSSFVTYVSSNAYYNAGWKYIGVSAAANYYQDAGAHYFRSTSTTGTAGGAITWITPLTIAASGAATFSSSVTAGGGINAGDSKFFNSVQLTDSLGGTCQGFLWTDAANTLKIGTGTVSGVNVKLTIASTGAATFSAGSTFNASISNLALRMQYPDDSNYRLDISQIVSSGLVKHAFNVVNAGTAYNNNLVLDRGNVGIGTASPLAPLQVNGNFRLYTSNGDGNELRGIFNVGGAADPLSFSMYKADATTIGTFITADGASYFNGGNVLIGTTTDSATTGVGSKFVSLGRLYTVSSLNDNTQESLSMYSTGSSAYRFYVGWGGTVYATNTTISAISDIRFKENIQDIDLGLDAILALKPRKFDWKEGKGKNIKNDRGFIAQEFEQIFPDLIDEWKDPSPEGEEPYKSVRQDLIPILVKAIQEQQIQIQNLQEQINILAK